MFGKKRRREIEELEFKISEERYARKRGQVERLWREVESLRCQILDQEKVIDLILAKLAVKVKEQPRRTILEPRT